MDKYRLPKELEIDGVSCPIKTDYRDILTLFEILNEPNLLGEEKCILACEMFYETDDYKRDINSAIMQMFQFMSPNEDLENPSPTANKKPLLDWEQDFNLICAPINKNMGVDIRGLDYLHWWTFLSAFMEIGECTFSTFVSIRDKINRGKKLDKTEQKIYNENKNKIKLKVKYDDETQAMINAILGKE
jgi:hypothetical protein